MNTFKHSRHDARVLPGYTWALVFAYAQTCCTVHAQVYPVKPVRLVAGQAAGGPIDIVARITAQKLAELLGQSVVVENRSGAGGTIGTEYVAKAAADGYTLGMVSAATLCIAPSIYTNLRYDSVRDFAPVSVVAGSTSVFVVHPSLPVRSVKEFITLAKSRPGQLSFGSAGAGSHTHLAAELFTNMAGISAVHVPYKGGAPALVDLMAGQIDFMMLPAVAYGPHARSGKLRALAVSPARRSVSLPDLPTIAEAGVPGYQSSSWYAVVGPAGTPHDIVVKLNAAIVKSVNAPEMKERLLGQGLEAVGNTPEQFAQLIREELPRWAKIVKAAGIKPE